MAAALEIVSAGLQATIQDRGRWGYQEYGVPICGCVAPHWLALGNHLVGNDAAVAGIEFRLQGPVLRARDEAVKIAICGDVRAELVSKSDNTAQPRKIMGWQSFTLTPDAELRIGRAQNTVAGFIAIAGGFRGAPIMGSHSTYMRARLGGVEGRALQAGDVLALNDAICEADKILPTPPMMTQKPIRVVAGPQDDYFDDKTMHTFLSSEYLVSNDSDRMGVRLEGAVLPHKPEMGSDIVSDGVVPGAVQVPGNGLPIVLLNDAQTVGGYPKIATVISADLHLLANALPGTQIRFARVSAHEACVIARQAADAVERMKNAITLARGARVVNQQALYASALTGGVVDMENPDHFPGSLDKEEK